MIRPHSQDCWPGASVPILFPLNTRDIFRGWMEMELRGLALTSLTFSSAWGQVSHPGEGKGRKIVGEGTLGQLGFLQFFAWIPHSHIKTIKSSHCFIIFSRLIFVVFSFTISTALPWPWDKHSAYQFQIPAYSILYLFSPRREKLSENPGGMTNKPNHTWLHNTLHCKSHTLRNPVHDENCFVLIP